MKFYVQSFLNGPCTQGEFKVKFQPHQQDHSLVVKIYNFHHLLFNTIYYKTYVDEEQVLSTATYNVNNINTILLLLLMAFHLSI
jgi:hypothetical protein